MNVKERLFYIKVDETQIEDIVNAIFHTVLLHRTLPTLEFKQNSVSFNSYLGTRDVDCKTLNLTYVCISSNQLIEKVDKHLSQFVDVLRCDNKANQSKSPVRGSIMLDFIAHRKGGWSIGSDVSTWERWALTFELAPFGQRCTDEEREAIENKVNEELFGIIEQLNESMDHVPRVASSQMQCDAVIDFTMNNIRPYRFSINHVTSNSPARSSVGLAMRKLLKEGRF